jgi:long-chain acyl-CoA synthetase
VSTRPSTYRPITIAAGIRTSAGRAPEKIALQEGSRTLTFAELAERINRVSNLVLHGFDVPPGEHAAILAPNCLEFIEIACGLAEAGIAPATVNPRAMVDELAFICNDAEARVLFVHSSLEELARSAQLETVQDIVVIGPAYEQQLTSASASSPNVPLEEWEVFCIPYTAGTTGKAKGVLLPHRARTLTFFAMGVEYGCYGPDGRALGIAPLYHGAGFAFSVAPIFFGGYCAILPKFDPEEVLRKLGELRITNTFMVPTHFHAIFGLGEDALRAHDVGSVRTIISNAAPLPQVTKERIVEHFGEDVLFEAYGSTEASIVSNLRPPDQLRKQQCVGQPFPCTSVRLLDTDGNEVPTGEVGELYSRSPYLFAGYWNRPEETGAAFRDGWFSAGDLARQDDEGYLYLVDRKNDKIVSGGVNIYPREIEEALARHPAVAEVAVFGVPDELWGEAVRAAVSLRPGARAGEQELIDFCSTELSRYKRPKHVDIVDRLPRNTAGKILRRELREPYWASRDRRIS